MLSKDYNGLKNLNHLYAPVLLKSYVLVKYATWHVYLVSHLASLLFWGY